MSSVEPISLHTNKSAFDEALPLQRHSDIRRSAQGHKSVASEYPLNVLDNKSHKQVQRCCRLCQEFTNTECKDISRLLLTRMNQQGYTFEQDLANSISASYQSLQLPPLPKKPLFIYGAVMIVVAVPLGLLGGNNYFSSIYLRASEVAFSSVYCVAMPAGAS